MVRNLRDLAGFTKVHLAPGQSSVVELPLRLCDLARYDEDASWTNRKAAAVTGAYVVDGGDYTFCEQRSAWAACCRDSDSRLLLRTDAGDCVANGGVWDDRATCPHATAQAGTSATIGEDRKLYGTYL